MYEQAKVMIALLDGDIYTYRVGYTTEQETLDVALWRLDEMVQSTLDEIDTSEYKMYLTDSENNFRRKIYPEYHANRKQPKPKWYSELQEHLIVNWKAEIAHGQEADDALGIEQTLNHQRYMWTGDRPVSIICSIDKDLKQVPGAHYNFVKKQESHVTKQEGLKYFYTQLLTGDVVDGIKGVEGIGVVKAEKILMACETEESLFDAVAKTYEQKYLENGWVLMSLYGKLLKIRQIKDEVWQIPKVDIELL